jgi:radical SAM superfamily enzyme YgiQ (UPF0313 family)
VLTLINTNRMSPPIAPVGMEYVAEAAREAGLAPAVLDLCWADDVPAAVEHHFIGRSDALVGLSFRNLDDSFWPSARGFLGELAEIVSAVRAASDAPIVLGGVGLSLSVERILDHVGADFAIRGDGEAALIQLARCLADGGDLAGVPGLVWWEGTAIRANAPAWSADPIGPVRRDLVDIGRYFAAGGQVGVETKRGCPRRCSYCADPLAKGHCLRARAPGPVADEVERLLAMGVDVLHWCDGEFNLPPDHALAVCNELIARGLGGKVRWYAYLAVTPLDDELVSAMRRAGCAGIDFTGDAACDSILASLGHPHRKADLAEAVRLCRRHGIRCMVDLLLGVPGETPQTLAETLGFCKQIAPDGVGAGLGIRLYDGTPVVADLRQRGALDDLPGLRRKYRGAVDLLQPTYYISPELGDRPAELVAGLIGDDPRFFAPAGESDAGRDHNYNDNAPLIEAIAAGARGAYWDLLLQMRSARP